MRNFLLLGATALVSACGGDTGPTTAGGVAPPAQGAASHSFTAPTEKRTYPAIGGVHSYTYRTSDRTTTQNGQLYAGDATTARNSGMTVSYDPRDAIFQIEISQPLAVVDQEFRFQDPAHRTDFGGAEQPQSGTPNLAKPGMTYLQAGGSSGTPGQPGYTRDVGTFFIQKPGTTTQYVTFAGFIRNSTSVVEETDPAQVPFIVDNYTLERGAFVFGERTGNNAVPKTGSATFNGAMVATLVYNPNFDIDPGAPTYFQWVDGSAQTRIDFAGNSFQLDLTGTTTAPDLQDRFTTDQYVLQGGATFNARGSGHIDLVHAGGFLGEFQQAWFVQPNGTRLDVTIAGSSADGAFFGPAAQEVGGGFRIVGGVPDERIDILGAFTGVRQ